MGLFTSRGEYKQLGKHEEWKGVSAIGVYDDEIYASHSNGKLYRIDEDNGEWKQIGDACTWKTRMIVGYDDELALLEQSGTLWSVDHDNGKFKRIGSDGEFANVNVACWDEKAIYMHSKDGSLRAYSKDGWHSIGGLNTWKSKLIFADRERVITVEEDNTFYRVHPKSGDYKNIWRAPENVVCGACHDEHIYMATSNGNIYDLEIDSQKLTQVGNLSTWASQALVYADGVLVSFEKSGTLFRIAL